ncbi:MAG: xanthine dehydrogenase accessory protein XdhC [Deltaproteobacteria bacterium]|nr:xanthine dehydrogenase accessory protein XdhC [Deltaproteobacteria bacterium]
MALFSRIAKLEAEGKKAALVTVVRVSGSTPREPGAKMIVLEDGAIDGTIGGGAVELAAIQNAREAIADGQPRYLEHKLTQELGMCCGGQVSLFIEPLLRSPPLVIFGAGHVGAALCRAASAAGFAVFVVDEREELTRPDLLTGAKGRTNELDDPAIPFGPETFVMVTTHDHALDQKLVERSLAKRHRWLGVIGSQRKAILTRERLAHKGFTAEQVAAVRCPVGLAIGAETPEEIAVSILAELIAVRRGRVPTHALETKART